MLKKGKDFEEIALRPRQRNFKSLFISKSLAKIVEFSPNCVSGMKYSTKTSEFWSWRISQHIVLKCVFGFSQKFNATRNWKNKIFEFIFDSKQSHQIIFLRFCLFVFIRNKVWNKPLRQRSTVHFFSLGTSILSRVKVYFDLSSSTLAQDRPLSF